MPARTSRRPPLALPLPGALLSACVLACVLAACGFDGAATGEVPCIGPTCAAGICATKNGGCAADALCAETRGAPTCTCKGGFSGDGKTCALATLTLATDTDLSTTNTGARTCADGGDMVAYSVTALTPTTATLAAPVSAGCLSPGDDVILINLQGTSASSTNTGMYESLVVKEISASTVTFATAKTRFFGEGAADDLNVGTSATSQRVALQRVPRYGDLVVPAGVKVTAAAWDGTKGGLLALSAVSTVTVDGQLAMDGRGYRGGAVNTVASTTGAQGESIDGPGLAATQQSSAGRGGGGRGDNTGCLTFGAGGGGGGHGAPGSVAELGAQCGGAGGGAYGDDQLTRLFLGSGGGAGGTDNTLVDNPPGGYGGAGGGIVFVRAAGAVKGALASRGAAGQGDLPGVDCTKASTTSCWDYSGPGGGGAGGSILVAAASFAGAADASGGAAGNGFSKGSKDGGAGGVGRVKAP